VAEEITQEVGVHSLDVDAFGKRRRREPVFNAHFLGVEVNFEPRSERRIFETIKVLDGLCTELHGVTFRVVADDSGDLAVAFPHRKGRPWSVSCHICRQLKRTLSLLLTRPAGDHAYLRLLTILEVRKGHSS